MARKLGFSRDADLYEYELENYLQSGKVKRISEKRYREFTHHHRHGGFAGHLRLKNVGLVAFARQFLEIGRLSQEKEEPQKRAI